MKKSRPDVELIQAPVMDSGCQCNDCPYMKLNSLEKIKIALEKFEPQIQLDEQLRLQAQVPLERMLKAAKGETVQWPTKFEWND